MDTKGKRFMKWKDNKKEEKRVSPVETFSVGENRSYCELGFR